MSGIAIVRRVDPDHGRVDVVVYPESCGRCEDNGGHCLRKHREVPARFPCDLEVQPGDHVRLGSDPRAVARAVVRLIVIPMIAAIAGFLIGGGRFAAVIPAAQRQISGDSSVTLGIPIAAIAIPVLLVGVVVAAIVLRGNRSADWPIITEQIPATRRSLGSL